MNLKQTSLGAIPAGFFWPYGKRYETLFQNVSYVEDGKRCFPFFLTEADAEVFCGAYSQREERIFAFQVLNVDGPAVIEMILECDEAIMNAQCNDEVILTPDIISALRRTIS